MHLRSLCGRKTCVSVHYPYALRPIGHKIQVSDISQWSNAWVNSFWQCNMQKTRAAAGTRKIRKLRIYYAICNANKCLANVFANLYCRRL